MPVQPLDNMQWAGRENCQVKEDVFTGGVKEMNMQTNLISATSLQQAAITTHTHS